THYTSEGHYDKEILSLGGNIYRFSVMEDYNLPKYLKELNFLLRNNSKYNIVHGHWTTFGFLYMFFAKRHGVKYRISHSHSASSTKNLRGVVVNSLAKLMKYQSNFYFACSKSAAKWLYGNDSK